MNDPDAPDAHLAGVDAQVLVVIDQYRQMLAASLDGLVEDFQPACEASRRAGADGIHDPSWTPFAFPWTDAPADEIPANYMRFFASTLTRTGDGGASLELVVRRAGQVVGMQAMNSADVARSRRMETGRRQTDRRGVPITEVCFELQPDEFVRGDDPVRTTGAEELRHFLGLE